MTTFHLTTTADRRITVEGGQPVTALAEGEKIASVHIPPAHKLTDDEKFWLGATVYPLLKLAGASIGWQR